MFCGRKQRVDGIIRPLRNSQNDFTLALGPVPLSEHTGNSCNRPRHYADDFCGHR